LWELGKGAVVDEAMREVLAKLESLRLRIKNTSSVRFDAARRVRSDYKIAQLTVVFLSLWAITISYILASELAEHLKIDVKLFTGVGVILPVFIVVFSLIEGGENYLRAYQLEYNARQLRELADQLYTSSAVTGLDANQLLKVFEEFSEKYSDSLERSPINHDDVDHYHRIYSKSLESLGFKQWDWWACKFRLMLVWCEMRFKKFLYVAFWFLPLVLFVKW
jgi:SMODS and SLOG-associating 2TM effector domain family 5